MSINSSGRITVVYEADTPAFHRFRGTTPNGNDVTFYIERGVFNGRVPRTFETICTITERPKEREVCEKQELAFVYGICEARYRQALRETELQRNRQEVKELLQEQFKQLKETNHLLSAILNAKRTQNNRRRSAKKRS